MKMCEHLQNHEVEPEEQCERDPNSTAEIDYPFAFYEKRLDMLINLSFILTRAFSAQILPMLQSSVCLWLSQFSTCMPLWHSDTGALCTET